MSTMRAVAARVAVNVAAKQLQGERFEHDVRGALEASGFDPALLILEVTESTLMLNLHATASRLQLLKSLGVKVAIDDFGTGFSSLAYVDKFPVDILKVDRSFLADVGKTARAAALIRIFVQLGRELDLEILAEGIESAAQHAQLALEHVESGQGYYFSRPVAAAAVEKLLRDALVVSRAQSAVSPPVGV
jgi:EAL domain-containing protein (putative c-di-GMP-specific phosphodiesterase class I)